MTGETVATTAPAPRWVCPTPDLDLTEVEWTAHKVEPGTPYDDEPSEMIDPGWYVLGFLPEHDPRDVPPYVLRIEQAFDEHGCDQTVLLAQYVMATLNLAGDAERERHRRAAQPSALRRLANGAADVVGALIREVR